MLRTITVFNKLILLFEIIGTIQENPIGIRTVLECNCGMVIRVIEIVWYLL